MPAKKILNMKTLQSIIKALKLLKRYNVKTRRATRFNPSTFQRFTLLTVLFFAIHARSYTITNINIGTDLNAAAWAKVNANNNNFVAWLNADDITNGYFYNALTNLSPVITGTAASFLTVSNSFTVVSNKFMVVSNNFAVISNNFVAVSNRYASGLAAVPADS